MFAILLFFVSGHVHIMERFIWSGHRYKIFARELLDPLPKYYRPDDFVGPLTKERFAVLLFYRANRVPNMTLPSKYRHGRRFL
jgi:hypothetical protein